MNGPKSVGAVPSLAGLAVLMAALVLMDQNFQHAGLWLLMVFSVTVGFGHGALDAHLLLRRFPSRLQALALAAAYLLLVVVLGWALSHAVSIALWLLLGLSAWHFGEAYGRWDDLHHAARTLTRLVVGGAPVMLPMWLSPEAMADLLGAAWQGNEAQVWQWLAGLWLALFTGWVMWCGISAVRAARYAWYELAGAAALNLIFSPLMAFALYFGLYHSPVHIWRVWRTRPLQAAASGKAIASIFVNVAATFIVTLALGVALLVMLDFNTAVFSIEAVGLRWLIVALAALTLPHLILISLCAKQLSAPASSR